jgi:type I restriction enzyme S subunit
MTTIWTRCSMAEIAPLVRRPVRVEPDAAYREIGIRSFAKGVFHKAPTTGLEIGDKRVFAIEPGDLLFNIVFAWEGAVAVASDAEQGTVGSHRFLTCVPNAQIADVQFLFWWFSRGEGRDQLLKASPGGAGRNRTLGVEKLAALMIPLPSLEEQKRIVARIDAVSVRLAEAQLLRRQQRQEANHILLSAFHQISNGAPRAPMRGIAPLVRRPVSPRFDTEYLELGVRSFFKGTFHKPALTALELGSKRIFRIEAGDLIFSNVFAWEGAIAIAGPEDADRVGSHRFITCVPAAGRADARYLLQYFQTDEGSARIRKPRLAARAAIERSDWTLLRISTSHCHRWRSSDGLESFTAACSICVLRRTTPSLFMTRWFRPFLRGRLGSKSRTPNAHELDAD